MSIPDVQICGTCCKDVGDDSIGCDECEVWVHNTEMCSGLSMDMIQAIDRYSGAGIKFVCTKCRLDFSVKRGGSPTSSTEMHLVELVKHLSQQLMGICSVVQQLKHEICLIRSQHESAQTSSATAQPPNPVTVPANNTQPSTSGASPASELPLSSSSEYRKVVREELRELQEQQKRRSSLVIRGLGAHSASAAVQAFEHVTEFLIDRKVTLTDVIQIPSETDLYRGKVIDDNTRKLILDKARQLKHSSQFSSVFIRRDLTYKQRSELRARRATLAESSMDTRNASHRPSNPGPAQQEGREPSAVSEQHVGNGGHGLPVAAPETRDQRRDGTSTSSSPDEETIPKRLLQTNE